MSAPDYPGHGLFLPYLLNKTTAVLNIKLQKILDQENLTLTQWRVLAFLSHQDDLTMGELAQNTMTEQSTLSRALRGLEEQGFVRRETNSTDTRAVQVHLQARGHQAFDHLLQKVLTLETAFLDGVSKDDVERVRAVLLAIIANA